MDKDQGQETAIMIGDRLHSYENEWVALDGSYQVIASAEHLTDLIEKVSTEELTAEPTYLQVLPHNLSFISCTAM